MVSCTVGAKEALKVQRSRLELIIKWCVHATCMFGKNLRYIYFLTRSYLSQAMPSIFLGPPPSSTQHRRKKFRTQRFQRVGRLQKKMRTQCNQTTCTLNRTKGIDEKRDSPCSADRCSAKITYNSRCWLLLAHNHPPLAVFTMTSWEESDVSFAFSMKSA